MYAGKCFYQSLAERYERGGRGYSIKQIIMKGGSHEIKE